VYCFVGCHVCVVGVCRLFSFGGTSHQARVCGDCLVVGGVGYRDVFLIDVSFPCRVDDLGLCYCVFG
jgi:hypothetical protein